MRGDDAAVRGKAGPKSPILQRVVHLTPTFHRLGVHCFLAPRGLRTDMVTRGCAAAAAGGLVGTWNAGRADGWSAFGDPLQQTPCKKVCSILPCTSDAQKST